MSTSKTTTKKSKGRSKPKKKMTVKVKLEQEVELGHFLIQAIETYGALPILKQMSYYCLMESALASPFTTMINTGKQCDKLIENAESGQILMYVAKHWDKLKELGKEYYQEIQKEVEHG